VEGFLTMWDKAEGTGSSFASCATAMATSVAVADAMREFVAERVWRVSPPLDDEDEHTFCQRRALISSQLMGLAFNRYILRMPPLSTATPSEIGRWVGPTLDRYVNGPLN
jgi:tetracycline repressor-like protein